MGKVYLITSGKGGVGKSTIATSLAVALARNEKSVLIVDADIGLRCTDLMLNMQGQVVYDYGDVFSGCRSDMAVVKHPEYQGVHLMSCPQMMSAAEVKKKDFRQMISDLRDHYDFVLIDSPAGIGRNLKITLGCADETVVVCTGDDVCLRDAQRVGSLMQELCEAHPSVIFNKLDTFMIKRGLAMDPEGMAARLDMPLIGAVPFSMAVPRALLTHNTAYECDDQKVYRAIENIAFRMMGCNIPFHGYRAWYIYRRRARGRYE